MAHGVLTKPCTNHSQVVLLVSCPPVRATRAAARRAGRGDRSPTLAFLVCASVGE
jgi:hypothetical protein